MSKWLEGVSPDESASVAARQALSGRLSEVHRTLRRAAKRPDEPDRFHALRVAVRRAEAALGLFDDLLPPRRAKRLGKALKRLRRAGGRVRDIDVFAESVFDPATSWPGRLRRERADGVRKFHAVVVEVEEGRTLARDSAALVARIKSTDVTLLGMARSQLIPLVEDFFAASPARDAVDDDLHRFRILGKRVRYAVELFIAALPADFRDDLYPSLAEIQSLLGEVNDGAVAGERLDGLIAVESKPGRISEFRRLLRDADDRLIQARDAFRGWWADWFAAELRRRFLAALGRNPDTCNPADAAA